MSPTGYTDFILKEGPDFEQFTMRCARAFGALITMRDDSMDAEIPKFKATTFYKKKEGEAWDELRKVKKMSRKEAEAESQKEYLDKRQTFRNLIKESKDNKVKYEAMLKEIKYWNPPTHDHIGLKNFMRDQIQKTIEQDCDVNYWQNQLKRVTRLGWKFWLSEKKKDLKSKIESYHKDNNEENGRVKERNEWVGKLRRSIKDYQALELMPGDELAMKELQLAVLELEIAVVELEQEICIEQYAKMWKQSLERN